MAIYKVTYRISGETTYRDVKLTSDLSITKDDAIASDAARRDSARFHDKASGTSLIGVSVIMVTEIV